MGGCCYGCLKSLVVILNVIYMLLGLFLQGTMLWIYFDEALIAPVAKEVDGYNWVIFVLMGVGTLMTIMGFLGCCGALQESQCMLATFFALVLVLFAGQVAACAWIYTETNEFEKTIVDSFTKSFQRYYGTDDIKTKAMDIMQKELECCGASGPSDWANARYNNNNDQPVSAVKELGITSGEEKTNDYEVPRSCCVNGLSLKTCDTARVKPSGVMSSNINQEGCANRVIKLIEEAHWIILIILACIAFFEIMAMIFSIVFCCTARRIDEYKA